MARSTKTVASRALLLRPFSKVVNRLRRAGPRFLLALAVLAFLTSTVLQTLVSSMTYRLSGEQERREYLGKFVC